MFTRAFRDPASAVAHRSAVTAADKLSSAISISAAKQDGIVGVMAAVAHKISVSAGNSYGPVGGCTPIEITPTEDKTVDLTIPQVVGAEYYDIFFSVDANPLWVARITEAQRAAGCRVTAVGTVGATTAQAQVETITVTAGATRAGTLVVRLTSAVVTGSPVSVNVAVTASDDTAAKVATKIRAALNLNAAITAKFTIGGAGADVTVTAKSTDDNDSSLAFALTNDGATGVTANASADTTGGVAPVLQVETIQVTHGVDADAGGNITIRVTAANMPNSPKDVVFAVSGGVKQEETATAEGTISTSGNAKATVHADDLNGGVAVDVSFAVVKGTKQVEKNTVVAAGNITLAGLAKSVITGAGITGSPVTVQEYVDLGDTPAEVAAALASMIALEPVVNALYDVTADGADIVFTRKVEAANDATLNFTIENDTCEGITNDTSSTDTTPGVAPDDAASWAAKARTAIGLDATVSAYADVSGAGTSIKLTKKVSAADDASFNIALDNDTCAGIVTAATSTTSIAGVAPDTAAQVAGKARTALAADADVGGFFTVSGADDNIVLTAKADVADDATMAMALQAAGATGVTVGASANTAAGVLGVAQIETATVTAGAAKAGTLTIRVTAAGMAGSPLDVDVVLVGTENTASLVAGAIRTALGANETIAGFFTVGGAGANVALTKKTKEANDATLAIALQSDGATSVTVGASADTTAGINDGLVNLRLVGTGVASNSTNFAQNNAFKPASVTPIDCMEASKVYVHVDVTVTDLRSAPSLTLLPFYKKAGLAEYNQGDPWAVPLLTAEGKCLSAVKEYNVDDADGFLMLVAAIAGQGTSVDIWMELALGA